MGEETRRRRLLRALARVVAWIALLVIFDLTLMALDVMPPRYEKGHAQLGIWRKHPGTGVALSSFVPELKGDPVVGKYLRNEAGFASTRSLRAYAEQPTGLRLVCLGDSHTDLFYDFDHTHMGVLQHTLRDAGCEGAEVMGAGHGLYSMLQSWLLYRLKLEHVGCDLVILNLYTGNDFYDIIREDDRPYLESTPDGSYRIHPPRWVAYAPPDGDYWSRSRLVYAGHLALRRVGLEHLFAKFRAAWASASAFGGDLGSTVGYIDDLRASRDSELWYEGAISAQALNQAIFFHHFPGAVDESLRRTDHLLREMRAAHPETKLVLSLIPSRILARPDRADPILARILSRLPLDRETVAAQELACYQRTAALAAAAGWTVVDPLAALRAAPGDLYFDSDWHLAPAGSRVLGEAQAAVVLEALATSSPDRPPHPPAPSSR